METMKMEAFKALVEIEYIITNLEPYTKIECDLPMVVADELNKLGDLGGTIEAYVKATGDGNMVTKVRELKKYNILGKAYDWEISEEIQNSIYVCLRSINSIAGTAIEAPPNERDGSEKEPSASKPNADSVIFTDRAKKYLAHPTFRVIR